METEVSQATIVDATSVATSTTQVSQDLVAVTSADAAVETMGESQLTIAESADPVAVITSATGIKLPNLPDRFI